MRIGLKNVAVKVERKHPHDCIISIGRLNHSEKSILLSMFPSAIHSLQCIRSEPFYQMTINAFLPNDTFIIHDSDDCYLTIIDRSITSQTNSSYATPCLRNWFGSSDSESPNDESISKEKTDIVIDLKEVAVKVEHQNPQHDYCMISIGRLSSIEKEALLNMFPATISSLRSRPTIPSADPLYQITITANLPDRPDFKICDSDVCILSIMDRMIISQTEPSDVGFLYERNWFDSNSDSDDSDPNKSETDAKIKRVRLAAVAVKVNSKYGDLKYIRIGRIGELEKEELEQQLPSSMLYFRRKVIGNMDDPNNYYELILKAPIKDSSDSIKDSNNCAIEISYDESQSPRSVCISDQHLFTGILQPWFESGDSVMAKETVTLTSVAVKLVHKQGLYRSIQIGRLREPDINRLEQILPPNVLTFTSRTLLGDVCYYEVDLSASAMGVVDSNKCDISISCYEKKPDSIYVTDQRCFDDAFSPHWFLSIAQRLAPPRVSVPDELVKPAKQIIGQIKKEETKMESQIICLSFVSVKVSTDSKTITIGRISESEKWRIGQTFPANMLHWKSRESVGANFYELTLKYSDAPTNIGDSNECTLTITYGKPGSICILKQIRTSYDNIHTWFDSEKEETNMTASALEKCIINDNATIMFWSDGTKTVTKTTPGDAYDPEIGIAMGIAKKLFGSKHKFDKYVNAVVSDMYKREAAEFTEKELIDALAENEKIITKAKAKHNAEKAAYVTAKNDPNHEGKLPELHSLKGDRNYRFAKIRKDIIIAEIKKRTAKKVAKAKTKAKAKSKTRARKKNPDTEK